MKCGSLLHVGCGSDPLPCWITAEKETRLDINESCGPDVVASMLDMGDVGTYDVVFCQHALEHVFPHEVNTALTEFNRVLKSGGFALVFVPDLEGVKPTDDVILESPAGPITGKDMMYGYGPALADNPHMAHKTGFVKETLEAEMLKAGFTKVEATRIGNYNLMGVGIR